MKPIQLFLIDDSAVVRGALVRRFASTSEINVVGTALTGSEVIGQIASAKPEVILIDLADLSTSEAHRRIDALRDAAPQALIVQWGPQTRHNVNAVIVRPEGVRSLGQSLESLKTELLKLTQRARREGVHNIRPRHRRSGHRLALIAIGTSTGGPKALERIIPQLPGDMPVPIVIVQHMPARFTTHLARSLDAKSRLSVLEGYEGAPIKPGQVWIAPGDHHMVLRNEGTTLTLGLNQGPQVHSCRPAVDVLFQSVARIMGQRALGVVLTGMGYDGLDGSTAMRRRGARIIAQDEASSIVWGMPGAVVRAQQADSIVPLSDMAVALIQAAHRHRKPPARVAAL